MKRRCSAVGVTGLLALSMVVAACGGGSPGATSPSNTGGSSTTPAGSAGPAQLDAALAIGSSVVPPTLDPTANASAAGDEVFDYNVYQHLVQLDPKGQVVPVLATTSKRSGDGLTYTFAVRKGVKFSNGDAMTAQDVVFSLERAANPTHPYPYGTLLADMKSVTAPDASTVVVTLTHPDNQFLYNLAAYSNGMVLDPKAVGTIATHPVGTGPYSFSGEVANYSITLVRNGSYWGGRPKLAKVVFRYYTDAQAENSALKSGAIQVIDNLSNPSDASQFKGNSAFKLVVGPTNGKIQLTINNSAGPMSKLKVRQAIAYATNKKAVLAAAGGYGTVIGSDNVPGDPWYLPSMNGTYAYNVTKAKQLLSEAGYPHGFSTTMTLPPYGYATIAGPLIQAELKVVGINATIKQIQFPLWISQVFTNSNFDLTIINHVEARDIGNYGNCSYYWKYADCAAVKTMLTAATEATSTSTEISGFQAVIKKINAAAVNDWLYNPDAVIVAKSDVVGLPSAGLAESFDLSHASVGGTVPSPAQAQGYSA